MKKLIVVVSGKKDAGKSTIASMVAATYLNTQTLSGGWAVRSDGKLIDFHGDVVCIEHGICNEQDTMKLGVKTISFASKLKEFCIDVLGLTHKQCYGTNKDKNSNTSLSWDDLPREIRRKYSKSRFFKSLFLRKGIMTARDVLQVEGTDIVRAWNPDAWADAGYRMAIRSNHPVVIIPDGRFTNEISLSSFYDTDDISIVRIRTLRNLHPEDQHPSETALDNYSPFNFDLIIGKDTSFQEQLRQVEEFVLYWLSISGVKPDDKSPKLKAA